MVTGITRRKLAADIGHPDISAGIPEARWMRAMTFERLVRDVSFASRVATTVVGRLELNRPTEVVIVNARVNVEKTAELLAEAHERTATGAATLIHGLAVPFAGFEDMAATEVKPDFAVVAPKTENQGEGSWLVVGDAKDYERLRSRVDDSRLLKGFLQVAVGAESCTTWSKLPAGMEVHRFGALAVPRNAFLQPEAIVEDISDHRAEAHMRTTERRQEAEEAGYTKDVQLKDFVEHLEAAFDPDACTSCSLFAFCRDELRNSTDPGDLLIELGVAHDHRPHLVGLVGGTGQIGPVPASVRLNVEATLDGRGRSSGQRRIDPAGLPGTINVVIAKSDAAALGIHGLALQRVSSKGRGNWDVHVFEDPQSPATRTQVMKLLGKQLSAAMGEMRKANKDAPQPVHLVVPDKMTADVLVSIADNMAGIELSRLRWERDIEQRRPPLTFNGEPATIPAALKEEPRTAVSFLLEDDRARAFRIRSTVVDLRAALAHHLVPGGPLSNSLRLDYLVKWATPDTQHPNYGRDLSDAIEASAHTPGARMTNQTSDDIHAALTGKNGKSGSGAVDPERYTRLIREELAYKCATLERALDALDAFPDSKMRDAFRSVEGASQAVWRRRLTLHASDLVRFGRTYRSWRNRQVPAIDSDARCELQLLALTNPRTAHDMASAAGTRDIAFATVVDTHPITLDIESRSFVEGDRIVLLHSGDDICVEGDTVSVDTSPKNSFKIDGLSIGPITKNGIPVGDRFGRFEWHPQVAPVVTVGQRAIIAKFDWFSGNKNNRYLNVAKPKPDDAFAPKDTCTATSYEENSWTHQWCCKPHEASEAEFADQLAERRARGELNPETWPPVRDGDAFETTPDDAPLGDAEALPPEPAPEGLTIDDLE